MRKYVIICAGLNGQVIERPCDEAPLGAFLAAYDANAHDGRGIAIWTDVFADAIKFDSAKDAHYCWMQVPDKHPVRDDGEPNRPLTAFTILVDPVEVES